MRTLLTGWGCEVGPRRISRGRSRRWRPASRRRSSPITTSTTATVSTPSRPCARRRAARSRPSSSPPTGRFAVRDAAAAMEVHVLGKPVKPAALRALLVQWRASRAAAE